MIHYKRSKIQFLWLLLSMSFLSCKEADETNLPVNEPGNFKAEIKEGEVELSWTAASGAIDGYTIERKHNKGDFSILSTVNKNTLSFTDTNPIAGTLTYRLYATRNGLMSAALDQQVNYVQLPANPPAIQLEWKTMNAVNSTLPAEIRAYETNSQLNGRNFKAWYVIADLSTGNIELKTVMSSTARKPSAHSTALSSETVYAITNGGYFGYNGSTAVSYSLVIDRGQKLADNIAALTRGGISYYVTRGVFGVTQQQQPLIKWVFGNSAYDIPSPNVEGETPQPTPTASFPAASSPLNAYSAIGGAPVLLKEGRLVFDFTTTSTGKYRTNYELLQTDIFSTSARPPRTVIGSTADNKIILFVCDGRQSISDGATLIELAQVLKGIGCVSALNLDGGGSSAIIAGGTLLNKPSDGTERAVPSVVAFVKKKN